MAKREELLISRSKTLRSRRASAASSFRWSSLLWPGAVLLGLVGDGPGDIMFGGSGEGVLAGVDSSGMGAGCRPESDKAILDLRLVVLPKFPVIGDCGWLILRVPLLRLDLREMSDWRLTTTSGARMSLDPPDTNRVCRRGDGLLSDDFRDKGNTSTLSGDGGL